MKKVISMLLCIVLLFQRTNIVKADENDDVTYSTVKIEYSDGDGNAESLQVMVKNNNVYVNAEEIGERLGYQVDVLENYAVIYNREESENIPYALTIFYYNSIKIRHMIFNKMVDYDAAFEILKNDKGVWIPFEQSLFLLNSSMLIVDNTILIDIPEKNIVDIYMDIMKENQKYYFDWTDDIGFSDDSLRLMGGSSQMVTILNGMLKKDGSSWLQFVQNFATDSSAYDSKYGEELAMLFCTYSDKELKSEIKYIKNIMSHLNGKDSLGKSITALDDFMDKSIGGLKKASDELRENIDINNNTSIDLYNRSYQALEKACDKADFLSDATELYEYVGEKVSEITSAFDKLYIIAEVVGYMSEFQKQDEYAVRALSEFVSNSDSQSVMSKTMKQSIEDYSAMLQSDILTYSAMRYLQENYEDLIVKALDLGETLGTKLMLITWNLVSDKIPFFSEGITETNNFMLSLYAGIFQSDAFISYQKNRNSIFNDEKNIIADNLYNISEYCYTYLKSCYITRNAALGSLNSNTKEKIPSVIEYQNTINEEISEYLIKLKNADTENMELQYGFLPEDNEKYLLNYDSSKLEELVKNSLDDEITVFDQLPQKFYFSSGVGAMGTDVYIERDGSFTGQFHDTEKWDSGENYKNGTVYICNFRGKFTKPVQVDEYIYSMKLDYLEMDKSEGEIYYENNIRYIVCAEPLGFEEASEFMIYLSGISVSKLPNDFLTSISLNLRKQDFMSGYYVIYNVNGKEGFLGSF